MKDIHVNLGEHVVLLGTTGSGKTYFFRHAFEPATERLLIVDTEDREFDDVPRIKATDGRRVAKSIPKEKKFRWRWVPPATLEPAAMESLAEGMLNLPQCENTMLYIDEATDFFDAWRIEPFTRSLFRKARKRRISIVSGSQRPAGFNHWVFDNSHHKIFFYVREYDRNVMDKYWKGISEELGKIQWGSFSSVYVDPAGIAHHLKRV